MRDIHPSHSPQIAKRSVAPGFRPFANKKAVAPEVKLGACAESYEIKCLSKCLVVLGSFHFISSSHVVSYMHSQPH